MQRRAFVASLGALGLAKAASEKGTRFYTFEHFQLKNGGGVARLHQFFSQALLPALHRAHSGPKMFLEAVVGPHVPEVAAVFGFSSLEEVWNVHTRIIQDEAVIKGEQAMESGPEPAFEAMNSSLVEATDFSPEIQPAASASPRLFELRVYHSPTWWQLGALQERFRGPEIKIFHRSGIHPVLYGTTLVGANLPNLTYLIPFADLAARERAWNAFGADPEWQAVRKESVAKAGEIVSASRITLYKATPYSPVR